MKTQMIKLSMICLYLLAISTSCSVIGLSVGLAKDGEISEEARRQSDDIGLIRFGTRVSVTTYSEVKYHGEYWGIVPFEDVSEDFTDYELALIDSIREQLPKKGKTVQVTLDSGVTQSCSTRVTH